MFVIHRERLLQALDAAHAAYYKSGVFGGPSLFFHHHALRAGRAGDLDQFAESVYALLSAWGMHRMGRGGSKMCEFAAFRTSLESLWPTVLSLQQASPADLDQRGWRDLSEIFRGIRCMATKTALVGNSKVMAHALPNLVPPVDREYTLKFLFGNGNITNDLDWEWQKLETILRGFFHPVVESELFNSRASEWLAKPNDFRWDTSPLKIVDNLVIGLMKGGAGPGGLQAPCNISDA